MRNRMGMVIAMMTAIMISAVIVVAAGNMVQEVPEGPVFGRDMALRYLLENNAELAGLGNPSMNRTPWHEESLTPEGWVGANTVQYTKGEWTVTVSNSVVLEPVYSVEIEFTGSPNFSWKGTVDQDGNVSTIESSM